MSEVFLLLNSYLSNVCKETYSQKTLYFCVNGIVVMHYGVITLLYEEVVLRALSLVACRCIKRSNKPGSEFCL